MFSNLRLLQTIAVLFFMKAFQLNHWTVSLAVCESGVPDDLSDRHVPHCVPKSLSSRTAATLSLLCLLLSRPPPCHRGENYWCLPHLFTFVICSQWIKSSLCTAQNQANTPISPVHFIASPPLMSVAEGIMFSSRLSVCPPRMSVSVLWIWYLRNSLIKRIYSNMARMSTWSIGSTGQITGGWPADWPAVSGQC